MNSDKYKIIFTPSCLLCPSLMAKNNKQNILWGKEILSYIGEKKYYVIQMPCPEASFPDFTYGIDRKPHGIKYYEELTGFKEHCYKIGDQVLFQIDALYGDGYKVNAIMGIEHSPTCAVNYMYTHLGTQKRQGIFIQYVEQKMKSRGYDIPVIGINRRFPKKAIQCLEEIESIHNKGAVSF